MIQNGIFWDRDCLIEQHPHENQYFAIGEDSEGNFYEGEWIEIDGEFDDIINIKKYDTQTKLRPLFQRKR